MPPPVPGIPLPLPVALARFEARPLGHAVQLSWTTASESKVARFEVQRRRETSAEWQAVGTLPATNAARGGSYQLLDPAPHSGLNYYRLASIDLDGSTAYSAIRTARAEAPAASLTATAYPNPNDGTFTLALAAPAPAGSTATLRDGLGRTLWQADLSQQQQLNVVLPPLPSGCYFLTAAAEGHSSTQRISVVGK